jgi:hypothetical protein
MIFEGASEREDGRLTVAGSLGEAYRIWKLYRGW